MITELNTRSQSVLRYIIDSYLDTGMPVGSKFIAETLPEKLSPATIRNVMSDLEKSGLLYAPHTSAGRMPTQQGLRFYVDGLMEVGSLSNTEREAIDLQCQAAGFSKNSILEQATTMLSGLSSAAGIVVAPKTKKNVKQIQFLKLNPKQVLIVLVTDSGLVENRLMETDEDIPESHLIEASNYLNAQLSKHSLDDLQKHLKQEIQSKKLQLNLLTQDLIERGLALGETTVTSGHLIIRGQSHLLDDVKAIEDLEKARELMSVLEDQETISKLIRSTKSAEGVQIYIGTENKIFDHSGWSMVVAPYKAEDSSIIGAIGVIGPTRLNYSRIIPLLDYTAQVMAKVLR